MMKTIKRLTARYPALAVCAEDIESAARMLIDTYNRRNKVLICGNGGSCADADHIVGELMKGFTKTRQLSPESSQALLAADAEDGGVLAQRLQTPLCAVTLNGLPALSSAFANDVGAEFAYAQQAFGLTDKGDLFWGISTSGNAVNVRLASVAARARGALLLGLTGEDGGFMNGRYDVLIKAPASETYLIQEYHLPIYHALCAEVEAYFFE